ncbi:putative OB-fold protein [Neobacillus niacini]|uniref:Zn-ribbon domain-containing OB-fold protein n=1 Tax=Neobacillus niacini TaxID=86668 RepID=UPI00278018EF|nr:Zn-ribbon domain-containing OB-fold protein [Neobacillus niacini]MDQ1001806.1 putative OB-fold protein [Neobacillus niacini]
MMGHSGKLFPRPTIETAPYWEGCHNHELLIQECKECGHHQFYPRIMCTDCSSPRMEWVPASGKGKVKSFTIMHRAITKAYLAEAPYVIALIELEEGPTMMSNVVQCELKNVEIGMEVEVVFEDWSEEISIPKFKPTSL